jgi:hypothetical protein
MWIALQYNNVGTLTGQCTLRTNGALVLRACSGRKMMIWLAEAGGYFCGVLSPKVMLDSAPNLR